jgi:hypothetical protein
MQKEYWAAAVRTACYLINRIPSRILGFKIPLEIWMYISYKSVWMYMLRAFLGREQMYFYWIFIYEKRLQIF